MGIEIKNINKYFGQTPILHDINLTIPAGEMLALLGPSGSGKTTLLRIIAGLEYQSAGRLLFNGHDVSRVHARDRRVGFVFQHYALFRHMTVFENVAFGLTVLPRRQRPAAAVIRQKVESLLAMVQLGPLANRYPTQLSGGQRQRVALARALAVEPEILLFDEPFGALDALVRQELRVWLRQLHNELKFTSVFVTHDQDEAMELADRVAIVNQGQIEQIGTPYAVMSQPASQFVLDFLGQINQLAAQVKNGQVYLDQLPLPLTVTHPRQGEVELYFRPWEIDINLVMSPHHNLPVLVTDLIPKGHYWAVTLQPIGWQTKTINLVIDISADLVPKPGERYYMGINELVIYQDKIRLQLLNSYKASA